MLSQDTTVSRSPLSPAIVTWTLPNTFVAVVRPESSTANPTTQGGRQVGQWQHQETDRRFRDLSCLDRLIQRDTFERRQLVGERLTTECGRILFQRVPELRDCQGRDPTHATDACCGRNGQERAVPPLQMWVLWLLPFQ